MGFAWVALKPGAPVPVRKWLIWAAARIALPLWSESGGEIRGADRTGRRNFGYQS